MYEKLAEIRKKKNYTLEDLASVIGKSPANYYKKETGKVPFTLEEAGKIADFFKLKPNYIFFNSKVSQSEKKESDKNETNQKPRV